MTVNDIINMDTADMMRMTKSELLSALKDVNRATSRRTRALRKNRLTKYSPAYRSFNESGGAINTSPEQTINQMRREFFRGQKFLKSKTSTVTGTKRYVIRMQNITGQKGIKNNSEFWDIYYKFAQLYPALYEALGSERVTQIVRRVMAQGGGLQEVIDEAFRVYNHMYDDYDNVNWSNDNDDTDDVDTYDGYF